MARPLKLSEIEATFKKWGVRYVVTDGAATRDNGSHWSGGTSITGLMEHHTAGDAADNLELRVLINGRTGLRGPLCNFGVGDDAIIDIVAVGSANHAGKGDPDTLRLVQNEQTPMDREIKPNQGGDDPGAVGGNSRFYGWEIYYGIRNNPTMNAMQHRAFILSAVAILDKIDEIDTANVWTAKSLIGHREWTPNKIDPSGVKMHEERALVNKVRSIGPAAAKQWFLTGKFPTAPVPPTTPGGPVAVIQPVYRGSAPAQDVIKALMASDVFPAPSKDPNNPYWSGGSWFKYVGIYARDGLLETQALRKEVKALTDLVQTLVDKYASQEPTA